MSNKADRRNRKGQTAKHETKKQKATPQLWVGNGKQEQQNNFFGRKWFMNKTQQPQYFKKRIGSTHYKVAVYQSDTSKERIEDKILRMAKNDVANLAKIPTVKKVVGQ